MPELLVNEIFYSIQGESTYAGLPCVFVRLTSCNLRCSYCDTEYAFHEGTSMSVAEILRSVSQYGSRLVEVTGGEPLLQKGVYELLRDLCEGGYDVLLETSGSLDIRRVDSRVRRIVDFKCPGSGMESRNLWENVRYLKVGDEVKFVLCDRADFDWARGKIAEMEIEGRCPILMSPVFGMLEPGLLAEWILETGTPARLQVQLHKVLWDPARRGV